MERKLQTILLALVAMMVPFGAWAQENTTYEAKWGTSAEAESFEYGTLEEAFSAARSYVPERGGYVANDIAYIQLQSDVNSEGGYSIYGGTFTLDLNGKTLQSNFHTLYLTGGEVVVIDSSEEQTGKVVTTSDGCLVVQARGGNITIYGGRYESKSTDVLECYQGSHVTIHGGEFFSGSFTASVIVVANEGILTFNGGTIHGENTNYAFRVVDPETTLTFSGGTLHGCSVATMSVSCAKVDMSGHANPLGISIDTHPSEGSVPSDNIFKLPAGYGFYDRNDEAASPAESFGFFLVGKEDGVGSTVSFNANNGTGTMEAVTVTTHTGGYTLPECSFTAPEGMMFKAWLVGDAEYQPGAMITVLVDTEVKAVWAVPYVISFDANGGVGEAIEPIKTLGTAILPECPFTAPEGMMFKAWLVDDAEYQPGVVITVVADTEVKAVWREYVPQIIIKMTDAYGDGWNDATIVVKQGAEEVGRATMTNGASATVSFDYDANSEYAFYWVAGRFDNECSFVILVDGVQALVVEPGSCTSYTAEEPFLTLGANWVTTTGIEQSEISNQHSAIIYDLQGRRVAQPQKGGIYIVNGKKVIVR